MNTGSQQDNAEPKEFSKLDSSSDWNYLGYVTKERMAALAEAVVMIHTNDISVVPDFTSTPSIYGVPGGARCALAGGLTSPAGAGVQGRSECFDPKKPHALVCNEIQGGNREFIGTRKLPGMAAWVATIPVNEKDGGGDLHFMSVCDGDLFSRVALADVSGHGRDVDAATMVLHRLMRKNIGAWDQSDFMRGLNDTFSRYGGGQYATAIVLSFNRITGHLAFTNAGHLPPLWYHASQEAWGWLEEGDRVPRKAFGLPVGLIPGTDYCQTVVMLGRSDLLVLYTDGITDAGNARGKDLGRAQLLEWARQCPVESPEVLGEELLKRVGEFRGSQHTDDETLVVLRRQEEPTLSAMVKVAWSNTFGRLLRRSL